MLCFINKLYKAAHVFGKLSPIILFPQTWNSVPTASGCRITHNLCLYIYISFCHTCDCDDTFLLEMLSYILSVQEKR
jgi:hypothetical protein